MADLSLTTTLPSYAVARDWLYAPSTYLLDSWEPLVEEIYLPVVSTKAGELSFYYDSSVDSVSASDKKKFPRSLLSSKVSSGAVRQLDVESFLDLREHSPGNLAHAITNHLPLALEARRYLSNECSVSPVLIFPSNLPKYVSSLFHDIGFEFVLSDADIKGKKCSFNLTPWISIRGERHNFIKENLYSSAFKNKLLSHSENLPKKIFISRRDTRCLTNEKDVEKILAKKGFQKIYMEDYDIVTQLAMISTAESVIGIHGAALSGLIFRALFDYQPLKVVELFSPGHMTNVYRVLTHQVEGEWVGVRGKLWPNIIDQAYDFPKKIHKYAYRNFEICLLSLEMATEKIGL